MPLTLYRRHLRSCPVGQSTLPAKTKRAAVGCECPIWIYGRTAGGIVPRQSTGYTDMADAEALRARLTADGKDEHVYGPRLAECCKKYVESHRHELGAKTLSQYELLLGRLVKYCEARGVHFIRGLTVDLLESFKVDGLPGLADTSKATAVAKMRCFLREAHRREWISESLADRVRPHRASYDQKEPYTDGQVEAILGAALGMGGGRHGYVAHPATFRLLLEVMLETGLRVSDAVRFDPRALTRGECLWIYSYTPTKQKRSERVRTLEAYIPDALKERIDACRWLSPTLPFAWSERAEAEVYERMQSLGARAGVPDCRPHRLRDTFAVRKLLAGINLEDVSRLLGHSSVKVTEMYYAKWISARKIRLERIVAETIVDAQRDTGGDRERNVLPFRKSKR